jgi:hypothetical protein
MGQSAFAPFKIQASGLAEVPAFPDTKLERARAGARSLRQTAALASALAASGRDIDLTGLDGQIGLICAHGLDLPPQEGHAFSRDLDDLLCELENLAAALRLTRAPP